MFNNIDPISMTMGWLVGRRIAGQRGKKQKEPIAYLYNGVRLPKLPESKMPHVVLFVSISNTTVCFFDEYQYEYVNDGQSALVVYTSYGCQSYRLTDDQWAEINTDNTTLTMYFDRLKWANFDILNEDSSVYLAASEPIPVYE